MEQSNSEKQLKEGIVVFKYLKSDGIVRNAVGTLMPQTLPVKGASKFDELKGSLEEVVALDDERFTLPQEDSLLHDWRERHIRVIEGAKQLLKELEPKPAKKVTEGLITYYDLLVGEWRSFRVENLIGILATY